MDTILLIAEEDQRIKNIVRFTFEQMDYKVVSTRSGASAVLKAKEIKPDLVLVDVSLPDKNGYEVSKEIKNNPTLKNTSVILLISSFVAFNQSKVAESLADDFIIKPFEFDEIIQKVKSLTTPRKSRINLPMIQGLDRKETFVNAILVLFAISLLAAPILYLNGRLKPSGIDSNLRHSYGVKNDPGSNKSPLVESKSASVAEKGQNITITLNEKGEIFINDIKCSLSRLKFEIAKRIAGFGEQMEHQVVFLKADGGVPYGNVMDVSAEIKKAGIKKIELAGEPTSLTKADHLDDAALSKKNDSKSGQSREPEVSGKLSKVQAVREGKPKTTYTTASHTEEGNSKKTTGSLKLTKASTTSSLKTTEKRQTPSKISGETKKKAEEKRSSGKDQIKTSQNGEREALEKVKKAERKKETLKQNSSAKNQIQIQMGGKKYVVKKGETLWRISKKFDTSVQDLMAANKLKDNKIRYDMVLIVPIGKEESQDTIRASERKNTNNFMKDIKIADWSLYVAWGMPTLHHVTIENTGNTAYSNIKIKVLYYYSYSTDSAKLETAEVEGILPITVAAYSKKTYLQKGITLKQGSASSMFGGTKEISIIGATPVIKDGNLLSLN